MKKPFVSALLMMLLASGSCCLAQVKVILSYLEIDSVPTLQVRYYNDTPNDVYFEHTNTISRLPMFPAFISEDSISGHIERNMFIKDTMDVDVTLSGKWYVYEHLSYEVENNTDEEVKEVEEPMSLNYPFKLYNIKVMGQKSFIDLNKRMNDGHIFEFAFLKAQESHIEYFDLSAFRYYGGYYIMKSPVYAFYDRNMLFRTFIETKVLSNNALVENYTTWGSGKIDEIFLPDSIGGYKLYTEPYECNELIVDFTKMLHNNPK